MFINKRDSAEWQAEAAERHPVKFDLFENKIMVSFMLDGCYSSKFL